MRPPPPPPTHTHTTTTIFLEAGVLLLPHSSNKPRFGEGLQHNTSKTQRPVLGAVIFEKTHIVLSFPSPSRVPHTTMFAPVLVGVGTAVAMELRRLSTRPPDAKLMDELKGTQTRLTKLVAVRVERRGTPDSAGAGVREREELLQASVPFFWGG